MKKAGLKDAMYEAYTAGEKDYSALVSKLKSNNIDAVYPVSYTHLTLPTILRV